MQFIVPLRQQYHGGTYTGDKSRKLIDNYEQINIQEFPALSPLIPVLRSASKLIHKVFGKILLGWEASMQEFQKVYFDMQQRIGQDNAKSDRKEVELGIEAEFEHLKLESTKDTSIKVQQNIIHNLIPSTKLHILLDHLEEF